MGSDFGEGDEDEGALGEAGVRDFEAGLREDEIAVEKDVKVEGAGTVGEGGGAVAAEEALDGKERFEEDARGERGVECNDGVEEAGLINKTGGEADGGGGVKRGAGSDAAEGGEVIKCSGESGSGRAGGAGQVCAEGDVHEGHGTRLAELARQAELASLPLAVSYSLLTFGRSVHSSQLAVLRGGRSVLRACCPAANVTLDQNRGDDGGSDSDKEERPLRMCRPDDSTQPEDPTAGTHGGTDSCCYPARFRTHVLQSPMRFRRIIAFWLSHGDESRTLQVRARAMGRKSLERPIW